MIVGLSLLIVCCMIFGLTILFEHFFYQEEQKL